MADNMVNVENYNSGFRAAVEQRQGRPMIDIITTKKLNSSSNLEQEVNVVDIAGVRIESMAPRKDLEATIAEIHPTADALELLQAMALTFGQNRGLIAEGETARGKTYLMNKFTQLVFGREARPVDFYCNGQTDTMSLMAKWVPKTDDPNDQRKWEDWVITTEGRSAFQAILKGAEANEGTDEKVIQERFTSLARQAGIISTVSQWELQLGALPKAMVMPMDNERPISEANPSRGIFMHIQEVGLAETHVIDALLQLGGEKGKLSTEIQLWDDGGRRIQAGPNFWIYYSTNPPENYPNRQGIDQALARRNTFFKLGAESPVSRQLRQYIDNNIPYDRLPEQLRTQVAESQKQAVFPIEEDKNNPYNSPENIGARLVVSDTVSDFHEKLKVAMADKKIEQRTKQKFEITDDEWNMVYDFMRRFATPDIEATLDKAVLLHYISRFTDKGQEEAWKLWQQIKRQKNFKQEVQSQQVLTYVIPDTGKEIKYKPVAAKLADSEVTSGSIITGPEGKLKYLGINPDTQEEIFVSVN